MKLKYRWKHAGSGVYQSENGIKIHTLGNAYIGGKTYSVNNSDHDEHFHKLFRILSRKRRNPRLRALMLWAERMEKIK